MHIDEVFHLALRTAFVILFTAGVVHKMRTLSEFTETVRGYMRVFRIAGAWAGRFTAFAVIAVELGVIAILSGLVEPIWQAIAAAGLLLLYGALIALNVYKGNRLADCGCSLGAARQELSYQLVIRNVILSTAAMAIALPVHEHEIGIFGVASVIGMVLLAGLMYQIVNQLLVNTSTLPRRH